MPKVEAYLFFDGNCAEAMRFYESTLGGTLRLMTHAESPVADQIPPGSEDRIMHARLELDQGVLMASDSMVGRPCGAPNGFALALSYPDVPAARRVFDRLADGGTVTMAFAETFWAEAFGMAVDRFGMSWMVNGPFKGA